MSTTGIEFDEIEISRYYSEGAKGGPEFLTSILGAPYGAQQRNLTRYDAIHKFEIRFDGARENIEFPLLLDFFMTRFGAAVGFRFFPFFDNSWKNEQIALTSPANGTYFLTRTYTKGSRTYVRRIVKPIAPITVTINGTDALNFSPYSVDYTKGKIVFQTPAGLPSGGVLRVSGEYCIPVAFDTDKVDISGFGGTFSLEGLRVVELLPAALGINDSDAATYTPDTFPPSTPTNVAAIPHAETPQTAITISWNASSALNGKTIVGYKVKVNGGLIPNVVGQTSVSVGSLAPNTDYTISVAAYDSNGVVSAFSPIITVRTAAQATGNAAPTATNLSISGNRVVGQTLTASFVYADAEGDAQNVAGAIWKWFRADTNAGAGVVETGETTKLYTLTGADAGKFIRFSVVPAAQTGTLTGVETFSAWTTAAVQKFTPAAPTNAITNDAENTADWTETPGFIGVTFYEYSTNGGTSYAQTLTKPIGSITGAHAAGQVLVRVKGSDIEGRNPSAPLAFGAYTASGAADTTAPTVGTLSATAFSKSRIDLSWTAGTDAVGVTGYRITWSLSSAFTSPTTITVGNVLAYTHSGLANETTYYYKLEAFDAAANYSAYSNTVSAKTLTATTASAPVKAFDMGRISGGVIAGVDQDPISDTSTTYTNPGTADLTGIVNPMTEDVYRRERHGQHTIPVTGLVAGASYRVEISMMEGSFTAAGSRVFNIAINGTAPSNMQNIDIYAATGATFKPLVREATVSANASGGITIVTTAVVSSPTISAIRIYDAGTAAPTDTTAPTLTLTAPAEGATVSGTAVVVSADANDNVAVRGVKFYLDGSLISGAEDTSFPYSVTFNADQVSAGTHTITAIAYDTSGNASATASRQITVGSAAVAIWKAGIIYDIDADLVTGVAAGSLVPTIPSRVNGATYSGTQTNDAYKGTLLANRINGHAAIELLKIGGYEVPALPSGLTALTIAFVGRQPAFDTTTPRYVITDASLNFFLSIRGVYECYHANSVNPVISENKNLAIDVPHLMICEIDSTGVRYYKAGTLLGSVAVANPSIPQRPQIGVNIYAGRVDAEITRFITVNKIWTATEKNAFIADMNALYGLGTTPAPAAFAISEPSPLPSGTAGTAYSRTIATTGGTLPHTAASITAGALPAGLTPNISAGAARISGTPTASGAFNFTISITDSAGATATKAFTLTVNAAAASTNYALASNGGAASSAQSFNESLYPVASGINGNLAFSSAGEAWASQSVNAATPAYYKVVLSEARKISEFDMVTIISFAQTTTVPTADTTVSTEGHITGYEIEYLNSSNVWTTTGVIISGNNKAWRRHILGTPITATQFRLKLTGAADGIARLVEFKINGVPADATPPPNEPVSTVETRVVTTQNGKIIIKENGKLITF